MCKHVITLVTICIIVQCGADDAVKEFNETETTTRDDNLENAISEIEKLTMLAEKSSRGGVVPQEDTNVIYEKITTSLRDLTESLTSKNTTYMFFKKNGVDRVIIPNIRTTYVPLRGQLLFLIKTLHNVAPTTANTMLPMNIIDMLLDVFENEDNLALKAHALDILYLWLPNNPKLQARVMKLKGLEPFYQQISKLDTGVIYKLLDLFNTILEEHLQAKDKDQRNRKEYENFRMYQMIGLIERMSTATVCNGLLDIFKVTTTFSRNTEEIIAPVFKLIKNIKPFCLKLFKGKDTALKIFTEIHEFIKDNKDIDYESLGINITEVDLILNEYNQQLREHYKDEL